MSLVGTPNHVLWKSLSPSIEIGARDSDVRKEVEMSTADAFAQVIERAVLEALRKALNVNDVTGRRLVTAKQAAVYLCLSLREIYNMVSNRELNGVRHGRRLMLDIRDLERWIELNKG